MRHLLIAILFSFMTAGCAGMTHVAIVHPGAKDPFDSAAYDALKDAKKTIDEARPKLLIIDPAVKPLFNALVRSYNTADASWQIYHATAQAGTSSNATQLNQDIASLGVALAAFKKGG